VASEQNAPVNLAWRGVVLFGAGAAACVFVSLAGGTLLAGRSSPPGPVAIWVADRGASRVYGLDANNIVARTIQVGSPLRVVSAGERGVWILRAREARARAEHDLVLATGEGRITFELELDRCLDLSAARSGDALCLTRDAAGARSAGRISLEGQRTVLAQRGDFTAIAGLSASIAIGTERGELLRFDGDGDLCSCSVVARSVVDLAPGPHADSVWVLDSGNEVRLIDAHDRVVWRSSTGFDARKLAPIPSSEDVWLIARDGPCARRFGRASGPLDCSDFGAIPAECALGLPDGGVLLALPGAIVNRDERGRPLPGQGGFHTLVDLALR
jgi:hypothetical protein